MARTPSKSSGPSPVFLALGTVATVAVVGLLMVGLGDGDGSSSSSSRSNPGGGGRTGGSSRGTGGNTGTAAGEERVDPFAFLPAEEAPRKSGAGTASARGAAPEVDAEGWAAALARGEEADSHLTRAQELRGGQDTDGYFEAVGQAKEAYEAAIELGAPILEALGEDARGTGIERRMSRWTRELVALRKAARG